MKKLIATILFTALVLLSCAALAEDSLVGQSMPDFAATTCEGDEVVLNELLSEKDLVVVNIFTSWCPPCKMEFPEMEKVYEELSDRMEIVAVTAEPKDTDEIIANYKADLGLTFPMGLAAGTGIVELVKPQGFPTTLFIDKDGNVAFNQVGAFMSEGHFRATVDYFLSDSYDGTPATAFNVYVCDQYKRSVPEAYVNFCTDTTCETKVSDENGFICFAGKPQNYHLQILKVPEGYSFDNSYEESFDGANGEWLYVYVKKD